MFVERFDAYQFFQHLMDSVSNCMFVHLVQFFCYGCTIWDKRKERKDSMLQHFNSPFVAHEGGEQFSVKWLGAMFGFGIQVSGAHGQERQTWQFFLQVFGHQPE